MNNSAVPFHLKKYIVTQAPTRYTPIDQAVWRFVLRQLKTYLTKNAHPSYLDGLSATGITVEEIPSIEKISQHLSKFGWSAAPVSGFIPPSAFLELQALKVLPIASDMRTLEHLTYTPAPDIVHEAAGHAPMVANPEFRKYLEEYALVAKKAIINRKDLNLYEAIRELSDIKEHPNATSEQIQNSQNKLNEISVNMGDPSEASILSRMAWWTTEYGLIGHEVPRIYGAGLLSSAGEAKSALDAKTKKIPFSIDCIKYSYDITEPQPQLFVTPDFSTLSRVLEELANTMAFRRGGTYGLKLALKAETVNTIEFETGGQISGKLVSIHENNNQPIYLQFDGPCQISYHDHEIKNQGTSRHAHGFGCPIGKIKSFSDDQIIWESGVSLTGKLEHIFALDTKNIIYTFKNCKVIYNDKILFDPSWGEYDLIVGEKVVSVFGGAADKEAYGDFEDFKATRVPEKIYNENQKNLFHLYQQIRDLRKNLTSTSNIQNKLQEILKELTENHKSDWLLKLEILEITHQLKEKPDWISTLENELRNIALKNSSAGHFIFEGLKLASQLKI